MRKLRSASKESKKELPRISCSEAQGNVFQEADGTPIDPQDLLLRMLLPTAVKAFFGELEDEIQMLCGQRYTHGKDAARWGSENGSVYLGGQKVAVKRPRVRDVTNNREVELASYERFGDPSVFEERVFRDGVRHVSRRDYEKGVEKIGGSFGFKKSTVSSAWKNATKKQLEKLQNRSLAEMNIVAVFIDGKRFRTQGGGYCARCL